MISWNFEPNILVTQYVKRIMTCQPGILRWVDRAMDELFPWRCVVCTLSCSKPGICKVCKAGMPWNTKACSRCGLPLPDARDTCCGACLSNPPAYRSVASPLLFEFPVNRLIHRFKFNRHMASGSVLAWLAHDRLLAASREQPDVLVPVPMHRWRILKRGLNPSFVLATQIGRYLDIPVATHELQRRRHTATQTGLDAAHRRKNLRGAFRWTGQHLDGKHIVLVDDVMTTGSTIAECSREILSNSSSRISAWTIARAVQS